MVAKQTESNVLKAAKADGASKPIKKDYNCEPCAPSVPRKSIRIECVMGGYKLCWSKAGEWQDVEAIAETVDKAMEIAKTYLEAAEE